MNRVPNKRDVQKLELPFAARINLENAHLALIGCRERLRRAWHEQLAKPYPATN